MNFSIKNKPELHFLLHSFIITYIVFLFISADTKFPDVIDQQVCDAISYRDDDLPKTVYDSLKTYRWLYAIVIAFVYPIVAVSLYLGKEVAGFGLMHFIVGFFIDFIFASLTISDLNQNKCRGTKPIVMVEQHLPFDFSSLLIPMVLTALVVLVGLVMLGIFITKKIDTIFKLECFSVLMKRYCCCLIEKKDETVYHM